MSFQGFCPKCRILLFDVKNIAGFGENDKVTCRSCGRTYLVFEKRGRVMFKAKGGTKERKAALS